MAAQQLPAEGRLRRDHEDGAALVDEFQSAGAGTEEIMDDLAPGFVNLDQGAERDGSARRKIRQREGGNDLEAFLDFRRLAGLALGEITRLQAVGVVLVFRAAFLAGRLVPRQLRGVDLERQRGAKLGEEVLAQDGFVHGSRLDHHR